MTICISKYHTQCNYTYYFNFFYSQNREKKLDVLFNCNFYDIIYKKRNKQESACYCEFTTHETCSRGSQERFAE